MAERAPSRLDGLNVVGLLVTVVGAACVLLSFTLLHWYEYRGHDTAGNVDFADLHHQTADARASASAITEAYFGWLSWIVLIVVILVGLAASLPGSVGSLRGVAVVLGLAGAVLTYVALDKYFNTGGGSHGVFDDARPGVYAALGGYVLAGLGAVLGRRRDA